MATRTTLDDILNRPHAGTNTRQGAAASPDGVSAVEWASAYKQGRTPDGNGVARQEDPTKGSSSPVVGAGNAKQGKTTTEEATLPEYHQADKTAEQVNDEKAQEAARKEQESPSTANGQGGLDQLRTLRRRMEAARQLTPEQKEKLAKRRKREAVASAIGDGLSALSNLFFTTRYAPNVQGQGQLSAKNQERWEKYTKELKDTEKNYADALQKAETAEREFLRKKAKDDADLERKRDADKRANQLNEANVALKQSAAAKNEEMGKMYKAKADALIAGKDGEAKILDAKIREAEAKANLRAAQVETEKGKPAVQQSQIEKNRKTGDAAVTRAAKSGSRSGSHGGGSSKYYGTFNGVAYETQADYDKAVKRGAKEEGVPTTEPNGFGKTKQRDIPSVARDTEAAKRRKKQQQQQTGGGRTGGGSAKSKFSIHKK